MRGESPATLPFEMVAKTRLILNQKEARTIGLKLPEALVAQAEGIIDDNGYRPGPRPGTTGKP
jgi:ABC-type uncharacterized transport system substrate-binding protein